MKHWSQEAVFYHIYPLGFCGAPPDNDFASCPNDRLKKTYDWIAHLQDMGVNALYLGPVFESTSHGYDTVDYFQVDRRLGGHDTLRQLVASLHAHGIRVILDAVFNHVGRDFWAFADVRQNLKESGYCDWFDGLSFDGDSSYGDPFTYRGWNGHQNLVKLNLRHPAVRAYLFEATEMWIREYDIDGLRLDAAECMDLGFLQELRVFCKDIRPDFWLLGEVVLGDYRQWVNEDTLDSVTNYECYKGLWSSLVDTNYFEIAYALDRQFGPEGIYRGLSLYNFADNHDVDRVASSLTKPEHLYPLYCLLFTMPGIPSIYYGSEWGMLGKRANGSDAALRPNLDRHQMVLNNAQLRLSDTISRLSAIRHQSPALKYGNYRELSVSHQQLAFSRETTEERVIVLLNASDALASFNIPAPEFGEPVLVDMLNSGDYYDTGGGKLEVGMVPPNWARILTSAR